MSDGKLAIDRVEVIPVRVDLFISNGDENVTLFDTGFGFFFVSSPSSSSLTIATARGGKSCW